MDAIQTPNCYKYPKLDNGIYTKHDKMSNEELRFRLMSNEGHGYIMTVATDKRGWQYSHSHKSVRETSPNVVAMGGYERLLR